MRNPQTRISAASPAQCCASSSREAITRCETGDRFAPRAIAEGLNDLDTAEIGKLIDSYVKAFETAELSERLERLEGMTHR